MRIWPASEAWPGASEGFCRAAWTSVAGNRIAARARRERLSQVSGMTSPFRWLIETFQWRRRLVLPGRHQEAVNAAKIGFRTDHDVVIVLGADELGRQRIVLALVVARHRPGARERVVDGGDLVMQAVVVGLVEEKPLPDHRPVVGMQRNAGGV